MQTPTVVVTPYTSYKEQFDEFLLSISQFFDLFRKNADKLEDLWLQLCEALQFPKPTTNTVFN